MTLNPADFKYISELLYKRSGLALTEDKIYLLESRLIPVAKAKGVNTLEELANFLRTRADEAFLREVTDAMTTNESMFFRDLKPFDQFKKIVLPKVMEAKAMTKTIRIWSAACSNGQEPYSLAMILKEEGAKMAGWNVEIIGTDLCSKVLQKAKEGIYSQFEVQRGLPITMLMKYFTQLTGSNWQLKEDIRKMVTFKEKNLLESITLMGTFDIILCRNVLIYFDEKTKSAVLENMAKMLPKHGYLYLGSTETTIGLTDKLIALPEERGLYIPA